MEAEIDYEQLTKEDLEEECRILRTKCRQLTVASDEDAQRIHELKRSLETANAAERFLMQELEQFTSAATTEANDHGTSKLHNEYDEVRKKYHTLNNDFTTLQEEYQVLHEENSNLRNKVNHLSAEKDKNDKSISQDANEQLTERLSIVEQENIELLHQLDEQRAEQVQQSMALAEKEKRVELMQDEVICLEENLRFKREEVEEKTRLLESAQEQLCEANAKINLLTSAPENKDRKGNSLFAEVDDQRQAMKKLLAAQKKSYQEMKKIYNESQFEIRRLKRENSAMHTELQACSIAFRNADRKYQDKLSGRISYLLSENESLELKLKQTQEYLRDLASERDVPWIDSMLNFCNQETEALKTQLRSVRLQNAGLEEQLRNVQQDMARWRFESLKSRCLLIDRENLLTENKISFRPQNDVEYRITENDLQKACPRIVPKDDKITVPKEEQTIEIVNDSITEIKSPSIVSNSLNVSDVTTNGDDTGSDTNNLSIKSEIKVQQTPSLNEHKFSPKFQIKSVETINSEFNTFGEALQSEKSPDSGLPSILTKRENLFDDNVEKKVHFSANVQTIFNLSPKENIGDLKVADKENLESKHNLGTKTTTTTTVKTMRTKSNVLVRRVVVNSKPKM